MQNEHKRKLQEKNDIRRQIFKSTKAERVNWKRVKKEIATTKEEKLLAEREAAKNKVEEEDVDLRRPYSLSIALPGQFLNLAQSSELRTYMAGQIARAATLYCVEEIVIYDESNRMTQDAIDVYYRGDWKGATHPSEANYESCFHLAKILEYLECPQYLRKELFPIHRALKYAGLLNPLDAHHHLKADNKTFPFREGVVLKKLSKEGRGPICNIGLDKLFQIDVEVNLPPGTRVTVEVKNFGKDNKLYRGSLVGPSKVRKETGQYWGYTVRLVPSLQDALDRTKYDVVAGVSPRGKSPSQLECCILNNPKVLLVFGGVSGVDTAVESDELAEWKRAEDAFDVLLATTAANGSHSERVEENVLAMLAQVQCRLEQLAV